jgi:aspartate beta-hydroxylase
MSTIATAFKKSIRLRFPRVAEILKGSAPEPESWGKVRNFYAELIEAWMHAGERERALACARDAVANGIWQNPLQRPHWYYERRLSARPIHQVEQFPMARILEEAAPAIQEEVRRVTAEGGADAEAPWQSLLSRGRWEQVIFFERGRRFPHAFRAFPRTGEALDGIASRFALPGLVSLLWLYPGSHLVPHCGHTNALLRIHLGIKVPAGAEMRVGAVRVVWQEGKCLVFDDSFEHEVWNNGNEVRVILLMDVFHAELEDVQRERYLSNNTLAGDEIRAYMAERGLQRIEMAGEEDLRVALDEPNRKVIKAFMIGNALAKVERIDEHLHLQPRKEGAGL